MDGAPSGIECAKMVLSEPHLRRAVHGASLSRNLASVTRIGLDLAKNVFQVHGVDAEGNVVVTRKLRRGALRSFFVNLPPCLVAMEACGSAHYWGREIAALGHEVRLIPPAHVKPYVRRNKTDAADAAAICEAAMRPGQRFVPVRSLANQAALMRHRVREQLVGQRTALLNALRGHLSEVGVIAPQGAQHAYELKQLAESGADGNGEILVCDEVRAALAPLAAQIDALDKEIAAIDAELEKVAKADDRARRLMTIPGVGPITATALAATVADVGGVRQRAGVRRLPWSDAASAFERRQGAVGADQQDGRPLFA